MADDGVVDLHKRSIRTAASHETSKPLKDCPACGAVGWWFVGLVTMDGSGKIGGYTHPVRCAACGEVAEFFGMDPATGALVRLPDDGSQPLRLPGWLIDEVKSGLHDVPPAVD